MTRWIGAGTHARDADSSTATAWVGEARALLGGFELAAFYIGALLDAYAQVACHHTTAQRPRTTRGPGLRLASSVNEAQGVPSAIGSDDCDAVLHHARFSHHRCAWPSRRHSRDALLQLGIQALRRDRSSPLSSRLPARQAATTRVSDSSLD